MAFSKIFFFFPLLLSILFIISPVFCDNGSSEGWFCYYCSLSYYLLIRVNGLRKHLQYVSNHQISSRQSTDEEDDLLKGINSYRASLNLTSLTTNENAECLADELAEEFKNQPCTNSTGANTVPGTEPQFANYPNILAKCHLNVSVTRDGAVMPACVPNLAPSLVLTNFTQSQYSENLNETN
ncbi:hypothetical protein GOBAR_AA18457 [Gossypium barbadense]|uniref:Uncharacterized GPI-anchored protein At5g19230-like domain-containing protein n=1 Tax=Gossypium barbadense TaxID=3634 RepID=A0A2P5XFT3_GOSBA|nr:hypothetical protein GOBAR_AA18457 [Gossypium barbadense]